MVESDCRAVCRTFAETLLGCIGASALMSDVAWIESLSASFLGALVAFLFAVVSLPEAKK